jgi:hypothetical protein
LSQYFGKCISGTTRNSISDQNTIGTITPYVHSAQREGPSSFSKIQNDQKLKEVKSLVLSTNRSAHGFQLAMYPKTLTLTGTTFRTDVTKYFEGFLKSSDRDSLICYWSSPNGEFELNFIPFALLDKLHLGKKEDFKGGDFVVVAGERKPKSTEKLQVESRMPERVLSNTLSRQEMERRREQTVVGNLIMNLSNDLSNGSNNK